MSVGKPIAAELDILEKLENENDKTKQLVNLIDEQLYENYRLWPNNYIAYNISTSSSSFKNKYTEKEKKQFKDYIDLQISSIEGDKKSLFNIFISMYAYPVKNYLKTKNSLKVSHFELN